jgi:NADPH:quinone reductase-like Zn-dependent oxidoreductase
MKAVVMRRRGGPEVLQVEEVPTPVPGPGRCWCGFTRAV